MKPPRPIFVIILLVALAILTLAIGPSGPSGLANVYLFSAIFFPGMLARFYVRWYRRRAS